MRNAALILLLTVAMGCTELASNRSAPTEWRRIMGNETVITYIDSATIRRSGDIVKMWLLLDRKTAGVSHGKAYLSQKSQEEFDCREERNRTLYLTLHSGNMGADEVVYKNPDPEKWMPIPPQSVIEILWKVACGRL